MNKRTLATLFKIFLEPSCVFLAFTANSLLALATVGIYHFEVGINPKLDSYFDALWWGVSTITTIGYGDIIPITLQGRLIGMALMITGPVLFVLFTGVLLRSFLRYEMDISLKPLDTLIRTEKTETVQIEHMIHALQKHLERLENRN